jgi:hypothetical protein
MRYLILILILCSMFFVGCASQNDVSINKSYDASVTSHQTEQTRQVKAKVAAIQEAFKQACISLPDTEAASMVKAFAAVMAADKIAEVTPTEFHGQRAKTGVDAQVAGFETISGGIPIFGMAYVSAKAIDKDKGSTTVSTKGDDSGVTISHDEDHATSIGFDESDSSASNTPDDSETVTYKYPETEEAEE